MTLRDYIRMRRISLAALSLRDTDTRILDIAFTYGFSSQEAFTRAFVKAFGVTPRVYRSCPRPISLTTRIEVFSPYYYWSKERNNMNKEAIKEPQITVEFIPAHKFIGIWDINSTNYGSFWKNGHDCDEICGTLESLSDHTLSGQLGQTAGWFMENGSKGYLYGIPVAADYSGIIPPGMTCREIPSRNTSCSLIRLLTI
ncbi:helix-turn-helix transcriptional regulator [Paenibacillus albidus]|uniref:helix-turn-helix transcriptional regulator n=1 Tax=Paenibacillus albidus TaxID=2041023 RepID=UPI002034BD9A|nr:helix-turn-helix transcriptional regulator [Paenibacillus albidus]